MKRIAFAAALVTATAFAATPISAQEIGSKPPELNAVKWYNTPPLSLENMSGKAVLVEVFRTW